jgi:hypothetical protein
MLAETAESAAKGEVAAIYARIREIQGVSVVNFIWRHLATIDGALPWAWPHAEAALPAIAQAVPRIVHCADEAVASLADGLRLRLHPRQAVDILRTYERGNAWNLLAMTLLAHRRAGGAAPDHRDAAAPARSPAAGVPPLPRFETLAGEIQALIDRLADAGPAADSGVRPSLWVHLALWPELLERVAEMCIPVLASPAFHAAHARLLVQAAERLDLPQVVAGGEPIDVAIGRFRRRIPEMLLIGRVLDRAHYSA